MKCIPIKRWRARWVRCCVRGWFFPAASCSPEVSSICCGMAASAGVYLHRGYIDPGLAMPVTLGVVLGSLVGAKLLARAASDRLRLLFRIVILALGIEMIYNGWKGRI